MRLVRVEAGYKCLWMIGEGWWVVVVGCERKVWKRKRRKGVYITW
tara:strand:+ start:34501 stop:34635 length:135 start_codon:yes stop_codon:yes gene_type:complete